MEVVKPKEGIKLKQERYIQHVLERYRMEECKPTTTPIALTVEFVKDGEQTKFPFREAVRNLLYLSSKTRPDIVLAAGLESRCVEQPNKQDVANVKRTLRYLKGSQELGILYT
jgi:hypothetical protein